MASDNSAFQTLSLNQAQGDLFAKLYELIACQKGRWEIIDANGTCACVLISKKRIELKLPETLTDGDAVRAMRQHLADVAAAMQPIAVQA